MLVKSGEMRKLANDLEKFNVPIFGTSPDQIDLSEDRARFQDFVKQNNLTQPPNGMASNKEEAIAIGNEIGRKGIFHFERTASVMCSPSLYVTES